MKMIAYSVKPEFLDIVQLIDDALESASAIVSLRCITRGGGRIV
jgi:hypothetical protein